MYPESFLRKLCNGEIIGEFEPFSKGRLKAVEDYIQKIVKKLDSKKSLIVKADFSYYGSGFASYINVTIFKADRSDSDIQIKGKDRLERINGIDIYISNLSPYWFYGGKEWTNSFQDGEWASVTEYISAESQDEIDLSIWKDEIDHIEKVFGFYQYILLDSKDLEKELWFDVEIDTLLADKPYQVFDCFFYWED